MDDETSKAEKLAAARKKLKEFQNQQRNKQNAVCSNNYSNKNATVELSPPPPPPPTGNHFTVKHQHDANVSPYVYPPPLSLSSSSPSMDNENETRLNNAPFITDMHQFRADSMDESNLKYTPYSNEQRPQLANYFATFSAADQFENTTVFFDSASQNCSLSGTGGTTLETNSVDFATYTAAPVSSILHTLSTNEPNFGSSSSLEQIKNDIVPSTTMSTSITEFPIAVSVQSKETESDYENTISNTRTVENLQNDLESAVSKIKLQSQALGILTNEREDLQLRLSKALREVDIHQENVCSLKVELQSNASIRQQLLNQLNDLTESLENFRALETTLRQNINDYHEENENLKRRLDETNDENNKLRAELSDTKNSRDMLALKFTQLGIEVNDAADTMDKNYRAIDYELDCSKRKCAELEIQLKSLSFERENAGNEYKQYVQSMQQDLAETQLEVEKLGAENRNLLEEITSQTEHIYTLEKQLQQQKPNVTDEADARQAIVDDMKNEIVMLKKEMDEMKIQYEERLHLQAVDADRWKEYVAEVESQLEILKSETADNGELQAAIESNRVAASQAISQNNKLKDELEKLNQLIEKLKEENESLNSQLHILSREKSENETRLAASNNVNGSEMDQVYNDALSKNDVAINTEIVETNNESNGHANLLAMTQLQEKFKSVLDKMADLTDEKQQLEHLVLQLQSETETIEEYVALYQKQRMTLRQRARENDFKMERISQEKERLLNIIRTILTTTHFDCSVIRELIEKNLPAEMKHELAEYSNFDANTEEATAVANYPTKEYPKMNSFYATRESMDHHPTCHCCSGKLITV